MTKPQIDTLNEERGKSNASQTATIVVAKRFIDIVVVHVRYQFCNDFSDM